jgi:NADH dehydrogenase
VLPVPGLADHGHVFRDFADAIALRNHVLSRLEAADASRAPDESARQLTFVFIGAGYAGVEALAELSDLVRDALRHYARLRGVPQRWVLVDAAPKILPEIPTREGDYAAAQLSKRGVEIHVSTRLDSADDQGVLLSDHVYQLPLFSRKLRVVVDWTVALLFRRDIAELGTLGHPRRLEGS